MFLAVMNVLAWIFVLALGYLALLLIGAAIGAMLGNIVVAVRDVWRRAFAR